MRKPRTVVSADDPSEESMPAQFKQGVREMRESLKQRVVAEYRLLSDESIEINHGEDIEYPKFLRKQHIPKTRTFSLVSY